MINRFLKIGGSIAPLPEWLKNISLLLILVGFIVIMIQCAYNGQNESVIALSSILMAIILSPIFSLRAELEKQQQIYIWERKYETYRLLSIQLTDLLAPIRLLQYERTGEEEKLNKLKIQNAIFASFYRQNCLLFSSKVQAKIKEATILIVQILDKQNDIHSLSDKLEKEVAQIINYIRVELKLGE